MVLAVIGDVFSHVMSMLDYRAAEPLMFNSGLFWVLSLIFLPIYACLKSRRTKSMIFVALFSLYFFYKNSGWLFLLLVFTSIVDWWLALAIAHTNSHARKRVMLWTSIACSLGILVGFKYSNFVLWNWSMLWGRNFHPFDIIMPVGISYYTFRTIGYVVDVYKGKIKPTNDYLEYLFFLSFFPCLLAGPIVSASKLLPQIRENKPASREMVYGGLWLFLVGVVKKAVIADYLAQYVAIVYGNPAPYSGLELIAANVGSMFQLYLDFSGYSDMAIGLSAIMGFDLGINFDFPFRSRNISEFWRRWHITLSSWLRDYVYIPLGGNRKGKVRQYVNLFVTFVACGLWHGASWTFVVWGALHGLGLCVHKALQPWLQRIADTRLVKTACVLLTSLFFCVTLVIFRADSLSQAWTILRDSVVKFDIAYLPYFVGARLAWCWLLVVAILLHLIPHGLYNRVRQWFIDVNWAVKLVVFLVVVQLVLQLASADVQPFIYAQF